MVMNLERQKECFKNHIAIFTDYGNIKILDFKNPNSSNYRIRFLFEEELLSSAYIWRPGRTYCFQLLQHDI